MSPCQYLAVTQTSAGPLLRELEEASSYSDSIYDQPGAGRIFGRFLDAGGNRVQQLATWILVRTRRNPEVVMKKIMAGISKSLSTSRRCERQGCNVIYNLVLPVLPSPPVTAASAVSWLFKLPSMHCPSCGNSTCFTVCDLAKERQDFRKLLAFVVAPNQSSCIMSIMLLTVLASSLPELRPLLIEIGARRALEQLIHTSILSLGDRDHLLSPSRRALATLIDTEVLDCSRKFKSSATRLEAVTTIFALCRDGNRCLLALSIAKKELMFRKFWLSTHLLDMYQWLWIESTRTTDTDYAELLADNLCAIYSETVSITASAAVIFQHQNPAHVDCLPQRIHMLLTQDIPQQCDSIAAREEGHWGRRVNCWRRALWQLNNEDPEGEPDDDWDDFVWDRTGGRYMSTLVNLDGETYFACREGEPEEWGVECDDSHGCMGSYTVLEGDLYYLAWSADQRYGISDGSAKHRPFDSGLEISLEDISRVSK